MSLNQISINDTTTVNTGIVYDISKAHNGATYTDLTDALGTDGINVPLEVREGGMSVKFIQTSDNKYVQYRLMSIAWSANVSDWQGVDDEPTAGSDNLVKSGGVFSSLNDLSDKTNLSGEDMRTYPRDVFEIANSADFISVIIDKFEKIIESLDINGVKTFYNDVSIKGRILNKEFSNKVDKIEGKGLIDEKYAENAYSDESLHYAIVVTDSKDKVLECIDSNGEKNFFIPVSVFGNKLTREDSLDYVNAELDKNEKVISGTTKEGNKYIGGNLIVRGKIKSPTIDVILKKISLNNKLAELSGKKISILGDSISTFQGYIPNNYKYYYPSGNVKSVDDTWWKQLIDETGMILETNNSYSGSQVCTVNNQDSISMSDEERLKNLGNPDIIVFWGGINDFLGGSPLGELNVSGDDNYDSSVLAQAYQQVIFRLQNIYPSAIIIACSTIQNGRAHNCDRNAYPSTDHSLLEQNKILQNVCEIFGVPFADLNKCGITRYNYKNFLIEGLHPKVSGMSKIKNMILQTILNNI